MALSNIRERLMLLFDVEAELKTVARTVCSGCCSGIPLPQREATPRCPIAISILIVDDEPVARSRLRELLADLSPEFPHRIVGEAANAPEALSQIELESADRSCCSISRCPSMTGIELARHISARAADGENPKPMPLIIFVTAFDEFAVEAFEVRAIDYLLKPVRAPAAARSAGAGDDHGARRPRCRRSTSWRKATNTRRRHLSVHERGRVILVPLEQIIYLKAELKYITVRTSEREFLIEESLTSLEEEFADRFVRIHRNALVARPVDRRLRAR